MSKGTFLFNPYTGKPRHPLDIKSDPTGILIVETTENLKPYKPLHQELTSEQVEAAAMQSGFKCIQSCCDVPQKFCSTDVWQGELRAFS